MPFFNYPSFLKALHKPQGVRIVEFEAIRRKYVNFLDFDFFLILLYAKKKKQKNNKKKSSAVYLNRCSKTFWSYKVDMLICFYFWYKFFQI